jgi:hypothetical protein
MSTDASTTTYECQLHAKIHTGIKRENFNKEFYAKVLEAPMNYSMRIYKDVTFGCHCPENYKVFDTITSEMDEELKAKLACRPIDK